MQKTHKLECGAAKGLQLKGQGSKSYTVYVYCTKEVYNGKTWEPTDVTGYYTTSFTAVEYTDEKQQNGQNRMARMETWQ